MRSIIKSTDLMICIIFPSVENSESISRGLAIGPPHSQPIRSPRQHAETRVRHPQPFHGLIEHAVNLAHPETSQQRPASAVHAPDEVMQAALAFIGKVKPCSDRRHGLGGNQ